MRASGFLAGMQRVNGLGIGACRERLLITITIVTITILAITILTITIITIMTITIMTITIPTITILTITVLTITIRTITILTITVTITVTIASFALYRACRVREPQVRLAPLKRILEKRVGVISGRFRVDIR